MRRGNNKVFTFHPRNERPKDYFVKINHEQIVYMIIRIQNVPAEWIHPLQEHFTECVMGIEYKYCI